jgi:hypothetical protein
LESDPRRVFRLSRACRGIQAAPPVRLLFVRIMKKPVIAASAGEAPRATRKSERGNARMGRKAGNA